MSGPSRMMYQNLTPKPEGTIFFKRSKPQGTYSSPHDSAMSMAKQLEMNIQGANDTSIGSEAFYEANDTVAMKHHQLVIRKKAHLPDAAEARTELERAEQPAGNR
jgi:hypothetical protein